MRKFYTALFICAGIFCSLAGTAQAYVNYTSIVSGLQVPVEVVNAADGTNRLFIVQQNGVIRIYDGANGGLRTDTFLYIRHRITYTAGGEQGLLSMAFHPAYETNGYFYIYYNNLGGDVTVARYQVSANPNRADSLSGIPLLNIPKPFTNHNGGHLQFAADSTLYFATGDGGSGNDPNNNAQNTLSRLGKMLRLQVYTNPGPPYFDAPANNPFIGNAAYDNLIWAYGLRNPFRWSFDRLTGDMWIGDVGQGAKEEVNFRPSSSTGGENYGWKCYEGSIRTPGVTPCDPPNYTPPIFDYNNPSIGSSSVVGGYVYRGSLYPALYGYYITCDVYSDSVYLIKPTGSGGWTILRQKSLYGTVVSFGEGEDGTLYAISQGTGSVYRVEPSATLAANFLGLTVRRVANGAEVKWTTNTETANTIFTIQYSNDGSRFVNTGIVNGTGTQAGGNYSFLHAISSNETLYYRIAAMEAGASTRYSPVVKLTGKSRYQVYPTIVRHGILQVSAASSVPKLQVLNSNGTIVFEKNNIPAGQRTIYLPSLAKGMYVVRLIGSDSYAEKVWVE